MRNQPLVVTALVLLTASTGEALSGELPLEEQVRRAMASYGAWPLYFEPNHGQFDAGVKFLARGSGYTLFLTSTEAVLVLQMPKCALQGKGAAKGKAVARTLPCAPQILRMKLLGANPASVVEGREELPGKSHYYLGNDPKRWRRNVPQYARVEYRGVYPGVSLRYYGSQRKIEYDFVVDAGVDPRSIRLAIGGADEIRLDADGNMRISLGGREVIQRAPAEGRFVLTGKGEVGFEVAAYRADRPFVLHPVLVYSTYLGGSGEEQAQDIAVDASGSAYITGWTGSFDFPTRNALQGTNGGCDDVFVAKLDSTGSALVYSTYLGGLGCDFGYGIDVDSAGNAYVVGDTSSKDFPTANAMQPTPGGAADVFLSKLSPDGSELIYSTYFGGSEMEDGIAIAVDASGSACLTGATTSPDFPTANPLQAVYAGGRDAFVAKLDPAGSAPVYSTYLGGRFSDMGIGIGVDKSGNAYVTGVTTSPDFPTVNPLQGVLAGGVDAFVSKLNATGSTLVYSTYLGGSGSIEYGRGIATDALGRAYVTGSTTSTDFPTRNAFQTTNGGGLYDAFVTKLDASGSALVYSTYLGGTDSDHGLDIAVDGAGRAYVTGITYSTNFPTRKPFQAANAGAGDAFVTKLTESSVSWSALEYSTYLGGSDDDSGVRIAVDASGNVYVIGYTNSTDFPLVGPIQDTNHGGGDVFVSKIGAAEMSGMLPQDH